MEIFVLGLQEWCLPDSTSLKAPGYKSETTEIFFTREDGASKTSWTKTS